MCASAACEAPTALQAREFLRAPGEPSQKRARIGSMSTGRGDGSTANLRQTPAADADEADLRYRVCEVCGQTYDTGDQDAVFHHGVEPHQRIG